MGLAPVEPVLLSDVTTIYLIPSEQIVLREFMDRPYASTVQLVDALYGDRADGGPEYASRCVYVWICLLRGKLVPPWGIESVKRRFGYELRSHSSSIADGNLRANRNLRA